MLVFSFIVYGLSNVGYALSENVYELIAARFVSGLAGSIAACNAYIAYSTLPEVLVSSIIHILIFILFIIILILLTLTFSIQERTFYMGVGAVVQGLGGLAGSGIAAVLALPALGLPIKLFDEITISTQTLPGWISAVLYFLYLIPIFFVARRRPAAPRCSEGRTPSRRLAWCSSCSSPVPPSSSTRHARSPLHSMPWRTH